MIWLLVGLILFLGVHSARMIAPDWRDVIISTRGEGMWKGGYSVISLVGLALIIWGYGQARGQTGIVYQPLAIGPAVASFLMILSFILLLASQMPAGRIKALTRHPMVLGVILWVIAHLLANGETVSVILFGAFLSWAVLNRIMVTKRGLPTLSIIQLRYDVIAIVGGFAAYLIFLLWAHEYLIGVSPLGLNV